MHSEILSTNQHTEAHQYAGISIFLLSVAAFAILTTEFIILGLLPPLARDLNISISLAGQQATLFAFVVMLAGPFLTAALARMERRKLFVGILLVFAVSNGVSAIASNFWVLAIARILAAAALPVFWGTASETAADLAGSRNASKAVSQVYLGIAAAFVFGIPLGTFAAQYVGWRGSFAMLAVLCLAFAILIQFMMPKPPRHEMQASPSNAAAILKDWKFIGHLGLSVLAFTGMFSTYTYLADTLERIVKLPPAHVGWWLMGFGAVGLVGNVIGGRAGERGPLGATVALAILLAAGTAGTTLLSGNVWFVVGPLCLWGLSYTALFPVGQVRVIQVGHKAKALAGTLNVSAANGGIALGAAVGGLFIEYVGLEYLGYFGAVLAVLTAVVASWLKQLEGASN